MQCCVDICVHVRFIFHALVCEVMRDVLPSLPLKCDIMFMITCMFISACMFIITSCPHLNCHFLMNKLSLPMAVDSGLFRWFTPGIYNVGPPLDSVQLVYHYNFTRVYGTYTIVRWGYRPTYN